MPEKTTLKRARKARRQGKAPTTQAGEFVREEMHHIQRGKHGAASRQQALAIALSKARRSGVKLPAPKPGRTSAATRKKAKQDLKKGRKGPLARGRTRRRSRGKKAA
jgi:hypothetical protein